MNFISSDVVGKFNSIVKFYFIFMHVSFWNHTISVVYIATSSENNLKYEILP